jgi:hypothetical protein
MLEKYKFYIYLIIVIFILFCLVCYINNLYKINNDLEILQAETPSPEIMQDLLVHKQPVIFRQSLYGWDFIYDIEELNNAQLKELTTNDQEFKKCIEKYLVPYALLFSSGWEYKIINLDIDDTQHHFHLENKHRHIIGQITGIQRIFLASPNQHPILEKNQTMNNTNLENRLDLKTTQNKTDFWVHSQRESYPFNTLEYIEIVLREGNILYIPKGWWYLVEVEEEGVVFEGYNKNIFDVLF